MVIGDKNMGRWIVKKYTLCSEELGEEYESDSLVDIYLEQKRLKEDDKVHHKRR